MSVNNSENGRITSSAECAANAAAPVRSKNVAAFLAVSAAAVVTPFLGIWGFFALCASYAAALAACSGALRFVFFVPGTALALFIYNVMGTNLIPAGCALGFTLICAAALSVAIYRRKSAAFQTLCVAVTAAVISIASFVLYAMYVYGSVGAALSAAENALGAYLDKVLELLSAAAKRYAEGDMQGASLLGVGELTAVDSAALLRTLVLSVPGTFAGLALVLGWLVQLLSRPFLILFGRRDIVTDKKRIVLPLSLVLIYFAFSLVSLFSEGGTFVSVASSNVASALVPAIFCAGIGYIADFFRRTAGRFPAMLVVMFIFSVLLMPTFFVSFVRMAGIVGTVSAAIRARMTRDR